MPPPVPDCDPLDCPEDCDRPPPELDIQLKRPNERYMFVLRISRPWCRPFVARYTLDVEGEETEFYIPFAEGVVTQFWVPPARQQEALEFVETMAGADDEWIAKVSHPAFMPPGYSPHDAGDG